MTSLLGKYIRRPMAKTKRAIRSTINPATGRAIRFSTVFVFLMLTIVSRPVAAEIQFIEIAPTTISIDFTGLVVITAVPGFRFGYAQFVLDYEYSIEDTTVPGKVTSLESNIDIGAAAWHTRLGLEQEGVLTSLQFGLNGPPPGNTGVAGYSVGTAFWSNKINEYSTISTSIHEYYSINLLWGEIDVNSYDGSFEQGIGYFFFATNIGLKISYEVPSIPTERSTGRYEQSTSDQNLYSYYKIGSNDALMPASIRAQLPSYLDIQSAVPETSSRVLIALGATLYFLKRRFFISTTLR